MLVLLKNNWSNSGFWWRMRVVPDQNFKEPQRKSVWRFAINIFSFAATSTLPWNKSGIREIEPLKRNHDVAIVNKMYTNLFIHVYPQTFSWMRHFVLLPWNRWQTIEDARSPYASAVADNVATSKSSKACQIFSAAWVELRQVVVALQLYKNPGALLALTLTWTFWLWAPNPGWITLWED